VEGEKEYPKGGGKNQRMDEAVNSERQGSNWGETARRRGGRVHCQRKTFRKKAQKKKTTEIVDPEPKCRGKMKSGAKPHSHWGENCEKPGLNR